MIKRLAASIREYKRDTILTPLLMIGEVVCECVIPLYTAQLVNSIQAGCTRDVIFYYGLRLLGLALLSLCFGMAAVLVLNRSDRIFFYGRKDETFLFQSVLCYCV